jgi:hypothetical protein
MTMLTHFKYAQHHMLAQLFDSMTEYKILNFWREYEPKKVEDLLSQQALRKTIELTAKALIDMQLVLEEQEKLHPTLASMEAWNRLMRIEADEEEEEAAAWGMTLDEYRNRSY